MADHVLSILVKALGATQASKQLKGVDSSLTNIKRHAAAGFGNAIGNLAKLGAVAGAGLGAAVSSGIQDLATLESATTQVDGAIKTMGQTGKVTSVQVAAWANSIETNIGAAFDDKAIVSATATLIRFGSVTPKNLNKAMVVMTDLAAKTGSVDSAATLLAKALADPTKAAGKLARSGVILTKVQQDNIKALVKAGKTEQAQAVLLDLLAKRTKGAAAATQGPYKRALSVLADVSEDAKKALAEGFLPVLERVATFLSKKLADPKVIGDIRSFGKGLADAFEKVLGFADKVPWDAIGSGMKIAGAGGKALLDAFVSLPPWVQTAVITGWGLNKLTGGALTGIAGELGKGLVKGVLGMNAGVVNLKAGVVNGAGGGLAGAAGGGASKIGRLASVASKVFLIGAAVGVFAELKGILDEQSAANRAQGTANVSNAATFANASDAQKIQQSLNGINQRVYEGLRNDIAFDVVYNANIDGVRDSINATKDELNKGLVAAVTAESKTTTAVEGVKGAVNFDANKQTTAAERIKSAVDTTKMAVVSAAQRTAQAQATAAEKIRAAAFGTTAAVNAKKLSVNVKNNNQITINARISSRSQNTVRISEARAYSTISGAATAS